MRKILHRKTMMERVAHWASKSIPLDRRNVKCRIESKTKNGAIESGGGGWVQK